MSQIHTIHGSNAVTEPAQGLGITSHFWGASIKSLKSGDHWGYVSVPVSTLSAENGRPYKITKINLVYATGSVSSIDTFIINDAFNTKIEQGHTEVVNLKNTAPTLFSRKLTRPVDINNGVSISFKITIPGGNGGGRWATIGSVGLELSRGS